MSKMHDNPETQKTNQTSVMPEKLALTGVLGLALLLCSTGRKTLPLFLASAFPQYVAVYRNVTTGAIIHGKGDYLAYSEEDIR